jgi:hypothetical protein
VADNVNSHGDRWQRRLNIFRIQVRQQSSRHPVAADDLNTDTSSDR